MSARPRPNLSSTLAPSSPDDRRPRWPYVAAAAASAVILAAGASLFLPRPLTDAAPPATTPRTAPAAAAQTSSPAPDLTWVQVGGVALPFSRTHGPRRMTDGTAASYSRTLDGAAIAAVQVLVRTSPGAGPSVFDPILATQLTGTNLPAMTLGVRDEYQRLRAQAGVPDGASVPTMDTADVRGYVVHAADLPAGTATVDVVLAATQLDVQNRVVVFCLNLLWQNDDWRVVAPASGDWGTAATPLGAVPSGLVAYGG